MDTQAVRQTTLHKFIFSPKSMLSVLKPIKGLVNKTTVLPILENLLFKVTKDRVEFSLTDLETFIITSMEVATKGDTPEYMFTVSFSDIYKFATNCEEAPATITFDEKKDGIKIEQEGFSLTLPTEEAGNYPRPYQMQETEVLTMTIDNKEAIATIKQVVQFVSYDDLRPAMTGVYIHDDNGKIKLVATDAHMLIVRDLTPKTPDTMKGLKAIIPAKACRLICECMKEQDIVIQAGRIEPGTSPDVTHLCFKNDKYTLITRHIDARYPDYTSVMVDPPTKFYLMRKKLKAFLKLAIEYTNASTKQIAFHVNADSMKVKGGDVDGLMEFEYKLPVYNQTKPDMDFMFAVNGRFLQRAVGIISDEYVKVQTSESPTKAFLIDDCVILMPLHLNQ